jgi:sterol desaturase/sphingolipid hydroxylase (fatty acid hydroxylase superfamily)
MVGALGFVAFLFFSLLLYILVKNREKIKKVSYKNRLVVVIVFVCLLLFSTFAVYYAGNWLAGFIEKESWKLSFQVLWTLMIVAIMTRIWESLLRKVKHDSGNA